MLILNRYFGKSTTRHKLSKYLGGLNTNNDLKMRNKQEEYNIEALNTKTISKESELMTNDQLKVNKCIYRIPLVKFYFDSLLKL